VVTTAKHLAVRLDADERTVRRAVEQGTVRASRVSERRLSLPDGEERYLRSHWGLLQRLRAVLRTEPNVRLAAVFGSLARGDGRADSDLDLLVDLVDDGWQRRQQLNTRLERAVGRRVELIVAERVARSNPGLLADALRDGRVLVDRGGRWEALKRRETAIRRAAQAQAAQQAHEVGTLLDDLVRG
jgi:predicted nucleotidyltransferase